MGPAVALAAIGVVLILIGGVTFRRGTPDLRIIAGSLVIGGLMCVALSLPIR